MNCDFLIFGDAIDNPIAFNYFFGRLQQAAII
jgi:hypothetical protein